MSDLYYASLLLGAFDERDRMTGRTTRQVDEYVQKLFNSPVGEWIIVVDHAIKKKGDLRISEHLVHRIVSRMKNEHNIDIEVKKVEKWKIRIPVEESTRLAKFRADQYELYKAVRTEFNPNWKEE